jgi:hypothetical protein
VPQGEPTVTVDGHVLQMAQASDGNWYAYFGNYDDVVDSHYTGNNITYGSSNAIASISNTTSVTLFSGLEDEHYPLTNAPVKLSNHTGTNLLNGQIGLDVTGDDNMNPDNAKLVAAGAEDEWPFISLFDLTEVDKFDIILEQAGADEVVTLDYDSSDMDKVAELILDRNSASPGSEVHMTINDAQLNIDPTAEDTVIFRVTTGSEGLSFTNGTLTTTSIYKAYGNNFDDNGKLIINVNPNSAANDALNVSGRTLDDDNGDEYLVFTESDDASGIFSNTDDKDDANIMVSDSAVRGTTATFNYNDDPVSFLVSNYFGVIDMDETSIEGDWSSGETLLVTLEDEDLNKNTQSKDNTKLTKSTNASHSNLAPTIVVGSPMVLGNASGIMLGDATSEDSNLDVNAFSHIANVTRTYANTNTGTTFYINTTTSVHDFRNNVGNATFAFINYDITNLLDKSATPSAVVFEDGDGTEIITSISLTKAKAMVAIADIDAEADSVDEFDNMVIEFTVTANAQSIDAGDLFFVDIFTFGAPATTLNDGTTADGDKAIANNAVYRLNVKETKDNSNILDGEIDFTMVNQLNYDQSSTYSGLSVTGDELIMFVHEDLTDEDSPRINFLDLGADGVSTQIADQLAVPTHNGVVSLDLDNYKIADTVVITLEDQDLNTDSDLIDVFTTSLTDDKVGDGSGKHVLDVTFNDQQWTAAASGKTDGSPDNGLAASGFTLVETDTASGLFTGSFQVPSTYYDAGSATTVTTTGTDIEVNYQDYRNASGEATEVGDGASVNANTGSVSFDRTVYPVPWGNSTTQTLPHFNLHSSAANLDGGSNENSLAAGDVVVHVRVTDADYDLSASGEDSISDTKVVVNVERGSEEQQIAVFGNAANPIK